MLNWSNIHASLRARILNWSNIHASLRACILNWSNTRGVEPRAGWAGRPGRRCPRLAPDAKLRRPKTRSKFFSVGIFFLRRSLFSVRGARARRPGRRLSPSGHAEFGGDGVSLGDSPDEISSAAVRGILSVGGRRPLARKIPPRCDPFPNFVPRLVARKSAPPEVPGLLGCTPPRVGRQAPESSPNSENSKLRSFLRKF